MREMIKLFLAVVIFSAVAGGLLAAVKSNTQDRIELQELQYVKGPAIKEILEGCSNDPLKDRFKIMDEGKERNFFVGIFNGKPDVVALETFGTGFDGPIGVMTAINLDTDKLAGIAVTTNSETPGVGTRTKTDPAFRKQFTGLPVKESYKVKGQGGQIDAVSGATHSSEGVCEAVSEAADIYKRLRKEIKKEAETVKP